MNIWNSHTKKIIGPVSFIGEFHPMFKEMSMMYKLSGNGEANTSHFIKLTLCKFLFFSIPCFSQSENGKLIPHRILGKSKDIACIIWLSYIPGTWLVPLNLNCFLQAYFRREDWDTGKQYTYYIFYFKILM